MKLVLKLAVCVLVTGVVLFSSCKKEPNCYDCMDNNLPIENAGADQIITLPKDSVTLDGSASTDLLKSRLCKNCEKLEF